MQERSATAPRNCCVLFAFRTLCTETPNTVRLLCARPSTSVLTYLTVVLVVFGPVVVVVGGANCALSFTGPIGWATR
jgi:hypothetical protein